MREASYYGMVTKGVLIRNGNLKAACSICGDMKKACYRRPYHGSWVYYIMPCHRCNHSCFRLHPQQGAVDVSAQWIDLPEEEQIRRIDRRRTPLPEATLGRLVPEQASEPAGSDVNEELPNEEGDFLNT